MSMRKPAFGLLHQLSVLIGRIVSLGLLLFWGAFFVEHLAWFIHPANLPSVDERLTQALHAMLLLGYLVSLRWDRLGSGLIALGAALFFGLTAGANALLFAVVSCAPIPFYVLGRISRPSQPTAM